MDIYAPIAIPVLLGAVAVYLLLPMPGPRPRSRRLLGALSAALALVAAGFGLLHLDVLSAPNLLFYAFAAIAVLSGGLLITQSNPVRAALSFALVVLSTCGLFLLQAAPFLMAATIIVYAGAIIVTFLFVIMLAQQAGLSDADARSREPLLACIAGFVLLGSLLYVLHDRYDIGATEASLARPLPVGLGGGIKALPAENVAYLGKTLFTEYLLPVELGGTLLLVATIGAIAIAGRRGEELR